MQSRMPVCVERAGPAEPTPAAAWGSMAHGRVTSEIRPARFTLELPVGTAAAGGVRVHSINNHRYFFLKKNKQSSTPGRRFFCGRPTGNTAGSVQLQLQGLCTQYSNNLKVKTEKIPPSFCFYFGPVWQCFGSFKNSSGSGSSDGAVSLVELEPF